jgi:hypothetical protein
MRIDCARRLMIQISIGTSRPRRLWATEHWKTLFDSLSAKGAKHDPRLRYPELAPVLGELLEERTGRFYPKAATPFAEVDDCEVRMIQVERVPIGWEFVRFGDGHLPDTTGWRALEVPFFGTIGSSFYEEQSKCNSAALLFLGNPVAVPVALKVGFSLSRARRDRDLDNLFDALSGAFNRLFSSIQELALFKTEPWAKECERLTFSHQAATRWTLRQAKLPSQSGGVEGTVAPRLQFPEGGATNMATTAAEAIGEAMNALGGEAAIRDVSAWISQRYPGRWKDVSTDMADLTYPGSPSSTYLSSQRFLERVAPGRYRLRK